MLYESWGVWLLVMSTVVSIGCLIAAVLIYRSARVLVDHTNAQFQQLQKQIATTTQGGIGMGQRLLSLENKLRSLQNKQEDISAGDTFTYGQAMQMFKQGADTATVASNCGLSNSEAELMALVQKQLSKRGRAAEDV